MQSSWTRLMFRPSSSPSFVMKWRQLGKTFRTLRFDIWLANSHCSSFASKRVASVDRGTTPPSCPPMKWSKMYGVDSSWQRPTSQVNHVMPTATQSASGYPLRSKLHSWPKVVMQVLTWNHAPMMPKVPMMHLLWFGHQSYPTLNSTSWSRHVRPSSALREFRNVKALGSVPTKPKAYMN